MKARQAILVALAAAFVLTSVAAGSRETVRPFSRHSTETLLIENGVRFSFRVPASWERFRVTTGKHPRGPISLNKSVVGPQGAEAIIYWTSFPNGDYANPCARLLRGRAVGRSAADLAAAVSTASGTRLVKGPSNVTLGGRPAKHVVLEVRKNVGCEPGFFYSWNDVDGGAFWTTTATDTIRVWIVAVNGKRLFIASAATKQGDLWLESEIQQIVESIRFGW